MSNQSNYSDQINEQCKSLSELFQSNNISAVTHTCANAHTPPDSPFSSYFDHTLLKPTATFKQIEQLCQEALRLNVRSVCIPPSRIVQARPLLLGSSVLLCSVVGFPLGYSAPDAKAKETTRLLLEGCQEFDMVINIGALLDGNLLAVYRDIQSVVEAASGHLVKVILETAYLDTTQIIQAGLIAIWAGAAMLKTSTGFAPEGATIENIKLLAAIANTQVGVKAAGGIQDKSFAQACIDAGADRLGASRTVEIIGEH